MNCSVENINFNSDWGRRHLIFSGSWNVTGGWARWVGTNGNIENPHLERHKFHKMNCSVANINFNSDWGRRHLSFSGSWNVTGGWARWLDTNGNIENPHLYFGIPIIINNNKYDPSQIRSKTSDMERGLALASLQSIFFSQFKRSSDLKKTDGNFQEEVHRSNMADYFLRKETERSSPFEI